ncbi:MAG: metallophosphoesterase [Acidimicrobiales bacterium]|jgi:hypothetical protein
MTGYDIIGDIHGCADKLEGLLAALGFDEAAGAYRHPSGRQAVFVGDLIDRGDSQVEVVRIVRAMHAAGSALVVMGNHEFNAIAYATPDPAVPGDYLRSHAGRRGGHNMHQHRTFLEQVGEGSDLHRECIDWFRSLPLYLDLGALRVAHACWHPASIAVLDKWVTPGEPVGDGFIIEANSRGTEAFDAVEVVLKGPEVRLPEVWAFRDPEGAPRWSARLRWWDATATSLRALCVIPEGSETLDGTPHPGLPDRPSDAIDAYRYLDRVPVFFGHYWFRGSPSPAASHAACVDYSAVRPGSSLVAYRWSGEQTLSDDRFVAFPAGRPRSVVPG